MNKFTHAILSGVVAFCLGMPLAMAHGLVLNPDTGDHGILINSGHGIHIDGNDVVIENNAGAQARIKANGNFMVDGKNVPVTDDQKTKLLEYARTVKDLNADAMKLGKEAAGFAISVVSNALSELLSGEDEKTIDKHANARADEFKRSALPICKDVRSLKHLQDQLAGSLQAFKPFAVIDEHDADDCEHDIETDD